MSQRAGHQGSFIKNLLLATLLAGAVAGPAQSAIQNPGVNPAAGGDPLGLGRSLPTPEIPADSVARNFGLWDDTETGGSTTFRRLDFRKAGYVGAVHTFCLGIGALINFHPQHVVRLPNKDGHAYFAVTNSDDRLTSFYQCCTARMAG